MQSRLPQDPIHVRIPRFQAHTSDSTTRVGRSTSLRIRRLLLRPVLATGLQQAGTSVGADGLLSATIAVNCGVCPDSQVPARSAHPTALGNRNVPTSSTCAISIVTILVCHHVPMCLATISATSSSTTAATTSSLARQSMVTAPRLHQHLSMSERDWRSGIAPQARFRAHGLSVLMSSRADSSVVPSTP